jgi:hypothetical protein
MPNREKRELEVEINSSDRKARKAISLDFSVKGLRIGGIGLNLDIGEKINISLAMLGDKYEGEGVVSRKDEPREIRRIGGRLGNIFFIKVDDHKFQEFVEKKFDIRPRTSHEKKPIGNKD